MAKTENGQAATNEELEQLKALLAEKEKQAAEAESRAASAEKQAAEATAELKAIAEAEAEKKTAAAENKAEERKMVKIRLPKQRKDEADVFVSVNDYTCMIQRGVEVEVPDFVAEVLKHQEEALLNL